MDAPTSGDIFPTREAIEWIDRADLTVPLEIPPLPPEADPKNVPQDEHRELRAEIARLKKEKKLTFSRTTTRRRISRMWPTPSATHFISPKKAPSRMPRFCSKLRFCS